MTLVGFTTLSLQLSFTVHTTSKLLAYAGLYSTYTHCWSQIMEKHDILRAAHALRGKTHYANDLGSECGEHTALLGCSDQCLHSRSSIPYGI